MWKMLSNSLRTLIKRPKNEIITLKSLIMLPLTPHNITLFDLDLKIKFNLLRLLQFLIDLKGTLS